jgi:tripartite-type tricarboxylate transporter receptor subunit TctC
MTHNRTMPLRRRSLVAAGLGALAMPGSLRAQGTWPGPRDRISIVVPFNTGGSTDRLGRAIATFLGRELNGTAVTVVNRPGAAGLIGSNWFLQQPDDGSHYLVTHAIPYLSNNVITGQAQFRWEDFDFVNTQWIQYQALITRASGRYDSIDKLVEAMRKPGEVSTGILHGSGGHLQTLMLLDQLNIPRANVRFVTYQGGGPLRTAVAGGHVDFTIVSLEGTEGLKGLVNALCVFHDEPDAEWNAPTANSLLQPRYGFTQPAVGSTYASLVAQASFRAKHPGRYAAFVDAYRRSVARPDQREFAEKGGLGTLWLGPERTKALLDENFRVLSQYRDVIRS